MKEQNQSGRSMIEMLGVLAIIGVLSVGGIAGYSKAMTKYRTNKTIDQVSQIAQGIRTLYGSQRNYTSLSANVIHKANIVSNDVFQDGYNSNTMYNPFGGQYNVYIMGKNNGSDLKAFMITASGIPQEACIEILTQDWGAGASGGLIALGTNGSAVSSIFYNCNANSAGSGWCAAGGVMSVGAASATGVCDGSSNSIAWKFY